MSVSRNFYVIAGYDLTQFRTENYEKWKWTDEGERLTCNQTNGHIQFFDDPMNDQHLYFGYVLASGDEYDFPTTKIDMNEVARQKPHVLNKIRLLGYDRVFPDVMVLYDIPYEVIVFEECS